MCMQCFKFALNLFDQTSALFITATCIVLGLILYLSDVPLTYMVLVVVSFLVIRIAEIYWRNRSSPSATQSAHPARAFW